MNCKHCGQEIHKVRPWNTRDFQGEWANQFGFPWCPDVNRVGADLQPHTPDTEE